MRSVLGSGKRGMSSMATVAARSTPSGTRPGSSGLSRGTEDEAVFLDRAYHAARRRDRIDPDRRGDAAASAWGFRHLASLIKCPVSRSTSSSAPRNPRSPLAPGPRCPRRLSTASATPDGWMSIRVSRSAAPGTERRLPFEHGNPVALNGDRSPATPHRLLAARRDHLLALHQRHARRPE
jgi:hypothetical protein